MKCKVIKIGGALIEDAGLLSRLCRKLGLRDNVLNDCEAFIPQSLIFSLHDFLLSQLYLQLQFLFLRLQSLEINSEKKSIILFGTFDCSISRLLSGS